ncbi:hypothetical protein GCM10009864_30590 [Streptomyces lunalinharesii]|uniref:Uncharacterized protein n=1 Tax=Streptomyces lunalinharesii TaxID=333384 RepID=A0ABN3RUG4_9ACTN
MESAAPAVPPPPHGQCGPLRRWDDGPLGAVPGKARGPADEARFWRRKPDW